MLKSVAAKIAHNSTIPGLAGNRDLRPLQNVIITEKAVIKSLQNLATVLSNASEAMKIWGLGEGEDLANILNASTRMMEHFISALSQYALHGHTMRDQLKAVRTREENLRELQERRRCLNSKADSADEKLKKMMSENKNTTQLMATLNQYREEIRGLDAQILWDQQALHNFKRESTRSWMGLKFGGLLECCEKGVIVGEYGKRVVVEIPKDETQSGSPGNPYFGYTRVEGLVTETHRYVDEVRLSTAPPATLRNHAAGGQQVLQSPSYAGNSSFSMDPSRLRLAADTFDTDTDTSDADSDMNPDTTMSLEFNPQTEEESLQLNEQKQWDLELMVSHGLSHSGTRKRTRAPTKTCLGNLPSSFRGINLQLPITRILFDLFDIGSITDHDIVITLELHEHQEVNEQKNTFECPICFERYCKDSVALVDGCEHLFCRECLRGYTKAKISERRFPISCPLCATDQNRVEHGMVNETVIQQIGIPEEDYRIFEELQITSFSMPLHCRQCNQTMFVDRQELQETLIVICPWPRCQYIWCKACQQPIDVGGPKHSCDGSSELRHLMQQNGWKTCPGCSTPVQKSEGCNHMTCITPACNAHFCYIDGEMILRGGTRAEIQSAMETHYRNCKLFDYNVN